MRNRDTNRKPKAAKRRKRLSNVLFVAAVLLLAGSIAGATRAALTFYSETYLAHMDVKSIGVTLVENGKDISRRDYTHADDKWQEHTGVLVENMLTDAGDSSLVLNKTYKEELTVRNSGTIDEYVRVTVYCYWEDESGKRTDLDPSWIMLHLTGSDWILNESESTAERRVLYFNRILKTGETAPLFADTLTISDGLKADVTHTTVKDENGYTTITTTYDYDGVKFMLEADVDAVQTHNAEDAILSAWGVNVNIAEDGSLSLK